MRYVVAVVLCLLVAGCLNQVGQDLGCTVMVLMDGSNSGSGVWVADDHVLTARHVGETARAVCLPDGVEYPVSGVELCEDADLALLVILTPGRDQHPRMRKHPVLGETVIHVGAPMGLWPTVSRGIVSGFDRDNSLGEDLIQIDASGVGPGSSGGPVFDRRGRLLGVIVGGPCTGLVMMIPAEQIVRFLDGIRAGLQWAVVETGEEVLHSVLFMRIGP